MRKLWNIAMALLLAVLMVPTVFAAEPEFRMELSVDGTDTKQVENGDVITVMFTLERTDSREPYTMYAMQNQIRYDSRFFELVQGSELVSRGIETADLALRDNDREFYMNFLSLTGGEEWDSRLVVGTFQLKVIGTDGTGRITCENYMVSRPDGTGSYPVTVQDVTVSIHSGCLVEFESNGGSPVEPQTADLGQLLEKPDDPRREGWTFAGWYRDFDLREPWDFDIDTVLSNMTLYAKWIQGEPAQSAGLLWLWILPILVAAAIVFVIVKKKKE